MVAFARIRFGDIGMRNIRNTNIRKTDGWEDYYATDPRAVEMLLKHEKFMPYIWECACGEGHISEALEKAGYSVVETDIVDRGCGKVFDFFDARHNAISIVTNPPYKCAAEFVRHALDISEKGVKIAMFLKLTFLEGQKRKELFIEHPPKTVYVFSKRISCGKNGVFDRKQDAVAYAWFVWVKGYKGKTTIEWI